MTPAEGESGPGSGIDGARPGGAGPWLRAVLIALAGAAAYLDSFRGAFVYDDLHNIVANEYLAPLYPPGGWLWADPRFGLAGRPVASFSFALNHAAGGLDPFGYHAVNLAVHLAAALLLFGLLRRGLERVAAARARAGQLSFATALLFAVHPLTTGAVTYLYQRCESLMGAFLLATCYLALRARLAPGSGATPGPLAAPGSEAVPPPAPDPWARRCGAPLAVVTCLLGAGCKETMVVAPLLVLLIDRALVAGTLRGALRGAPAMYAGLFSSWLALAVLVVTSGARADSVGFGFELSWWDYLRAQAGGVLLYLGRALWPATLVFDYGTPVPERLSGWLPQGLVVLALLAWTAAGLLRNRPLALLGAWWFLILGPSSSVLPIVTEVWVEHRAYLPLAAVLTGVVLAGARLLGTGAAGRVALAAAALALGLRTHLRQQDYRSEVRLWRATVEARPDNARALYSLGDALRREGRPREALELYEQAVALDPEQPFYRVNPGVLALELELVERAAEHLEAAVRLKPEWSLAHQNLGSARLAGGDLERAAEAFERALELAPDNLDAARGLAMVHARAGRPRQAAGLLEEVLRRRPDDLEALVELGELLLEGPPARRDPARALELARRAARLSSDARVRALLERARTAAGG